jgi:hypothetical protein
MEASKYDHISNDSKDSEAIPVPNAPLLKPMKSPFNNDQII